MSKRTEMREKRQRERVRNKILMILFMVAGSLLIVFALILPTVQGVIDKANETEVPVIPIVPRTFDAPVDGTSIGDPSAPVRMDTWEDFQCPACVNFSQIVMSQIIDTYVETGVLYYTFHFYPFIDNYAETRESDQSASAALCAGEQEAFWDYHDILFANWDGENDGAFADKRLVRFAETLSLDMDAFNACFEESRYQDLIDQDFALGETSGVTSTPYVFINMQRVLSQAGEQYVPGFEDISAAIQAALGGE